MVEPIEGLSLKEEKEESPIPYAFDAQRDIWLATFSLRPIKDRYNSLTISEKDVIKIKGKLSKAYPKVFSKKLKNRGRYFPLHIPSQTDEQIREQIVGDSAMRLEDEIKFVKAVGLNNGDRVLDLGAGFGRTSLLLAEHANVHVLSMDIDEEKIKLLQSVLSNYRFNDGKLGNEKITPILGDATKLRQNIPSGGKVDVVIIKDIIGLLSQLDTDPNKKAVCLALAKKLEIFALNTTEFLKEGGRVIVWDGDLTNDYSLKTLEMGMYLNGFKEKERASLIKFQLALGQKLEDVQASFGIFFYEPNDEYLRALRSVYRQEQIF